MKNFIIGLLIGAGAILPGISSGVFCVIFGLYEKMIDSILHFFKNIKENLLFLCPIVFGALISIFIISKILLICFNNYNIYTCYAFIGLILGSLPSVFKQAKVNKTNFYHALCFIFSLVLSIYLSLIETQKVHNISELSSPYLIIVGVIMSTGIVVPGVSKTAILIIMGVYSSYLTAISTLDFNILIPIGFGLIVGSIICIYVINFLFLNFKSYTYYLISGFVVGSCFIIFPGFSFNSKYIFGVLICVLCFYTVRNIEKISNLN